MSTAITLDMLRSASSAEFPVIDLGGYNAGDMLKRWTNDRFLSTRHLAINLTDRQRYSTPFFYTPHIDHPIVCLPTCCGADNPPRYPPIIYGEYRVWWLNTNYGAKLNKTSVVPRSAKRSL